MNNEIKVMNNDEIRDFCIKKDLKIFELEQEIERLTELCNKYEEEHNTTFEEWKKTISIINEIEKELNKDFNTYMMGNRQIGKVYKAGADNYRMHIYLRLQELKGSDKE